MPKRVKNYIFTDQSCWMAIIDTIYTISIDNSPKSQGPTLLLVTAQSGRRFGGFSKKGKFNKSFLYRLDSRERVDVYPKRAHEALFNARGNGPNFIEGLCMHCSTFGKPHWAGSSYYPAFPDGCDVAGGNGWWGT